MTALQKASSLKIRNHSLRRKYANKMKEDEELDQYLDGNKIQLNSAYLF